MESASKRKAASALGADSDNRPAKRQKGAAESNTSSETIETTQAQGQKFLDSLRAAKDKTGRTIADHFLTLPDKDELPEYYEYIKMPLALDTLEEKLKNGEYTSLAQLESDCKRLVNNAKQFNDKKSIIYEDAERLRKTASNWMVKHNPAYRNGNYAAVATPIPGEDDSTPSRPPPRFASASKSTSATPDSTDRPRRAAAQAQAQLATPAPSKLRHSASVAPPEDEEEDEENDYSGKTYQQAQEQLLTDIIEYEDGGLQIFQPFVNLPSRSLKDYYQLIKEPMSLAQIQKKVRGVVGREAPTGKTLFKSWDSLASSMALIWDNARLYNEDGSEIYTLSQELEEVFEQKLHEARTSVPEPPQPKLKLNMSGGAVPKQQLKIKLRQSPGSDPNTPGARSSATPGIVIDNEALSRQQRHVLDSVNGNKSSRPSSAGKGGTPTASSNPFVGQRGNSASIPPLSAPINGVKQDVQSPALSAIRPASNASDGQSQRNSIAGHTPIMAPPHALSRPASGSPHPNGIPQAGFPTPFQQPVYVPPPPPAPRVDYLRKEPLKSINEALIPKISLNTHPALNLAKPWSADVYANKQKTAHSVTMVVNQANSYLQVIPKVPIALTGRLYRLFVSVNGNKTFEVNRVPVTAGINGASPGPGYEGGKKKGEPVYEAKLIGGVNRIEVELVAEKERKTPTDATKETPKDTSKDGKEQVEIEKCTIFLHLMRQSSY